MWKNYLLLTNSLAVFRRLTVVVKAPAHIRQGITFYILGTSCSSERVVEILFVWRCSLKI